MRRIKNLNIISLVLILVVTIIPIINAIASPWPAFNVCCEKTTEGAWCQNTLEENCDEGFRKTPTSCEATSFCRPGVCFDFCCVLVQPGCQKHCGSCPP